MERNPVSKWLGPVLLVMVLLSACTDSTAPDVLRCTTSEQCPAGSGCDDGICRQECVTSGDCTGSQVCISGFCRMPCTGDGDCADGDLCENGYCEPKDEPDGGPPDGGDNCIDEDQDGYGVNCPAGPDCDDSNRAVNPTAPEACYDGVDNDCDGQTDEADCGCTQGDRRACYTGPVDTNAIGICRPGIAVCGDNREYGPCQGEVVPADELCDGVDQNCDGQVDEGLLNRCGQCAPPDEQLVEICGNGMDDDCNGQMDENCSCDPDCQCEDPGSGTNCTCHPPVGQPCYSGPPSSLGFGPCQGGTHDCQVQPDGSYSWTICAGEVLPANECTAGQANGVDDDCDGLTDEDCLPDLDQDGYSPPQDCNEGDPTINPGAPEACDGLDNNCNGLVDEGATNPCGQCGPTPDEVCGDGLDNDCDGTVDESCGGCSGSESRPCYRGPDGTQGVGQCVWGTLTCDGEFWGACEGDVLPDPEICDGIDNDCDDLVDEAGAIGANACGFCDWTEICDQVDNDCDGFTDEGLANGCGQCPPFPEESVCDGLDDDCDGLIDEGLLTACGTCPGEACYEEEWDAPGDCEADHRECDGTIPDPGDPDSVTLGQGTVRTPFIYISVTGRNQVAKLDTETGEKIWQVDSHGTWPSRTAVALDFSVWVGNRGFGGTSNGVHLDADGNLICRVDCTQTCRGVAIDGDGNAWFGEWDDGTLFKVHGSNVDNVSCSNPPCCQVLATVETGVNVYGMAVDGNGFLWTASAPNTVKVNTATATVVETVANPSFYGVAIDQNNDVWFGGWSGSGVVHKVGGSAPHTIFNSAVNQVTAVTVAPDGYIWGSQYGNHRVVKIDPNTGAEVCSAAVPNGTNPHGVAVDANGKIWVPNRYGGYANRFDSNCNLDGSFPVDPGYELYTYSDMTGMQLRTITTREGHWIQNFDTGYVAPIWHSATWEATTPPATSVTVTFTSADTEAGLQTNPSPACGPFNQSPADLASCPELQGHRWLSADVRLGTTQDGMRPTFSNLRVFWSR